jgi:hypothetical protein
MENPEYQNDNAALDKNPCVGFLVHDDVPPPLKKSSVFTEVQGIS